MTPFLQAVAQDIYRRFGDNLSRTAVIFPGKRAGLWFDRYLYECAGHPLWSPSYISVDELFSNLSSLGKESPIRTICILHEIFCRQTHSTEALDDFYYWGELMLSDFDDIDKNHVDADRLFVNLSDIKELEGKFDHLTSEQRELLSQFFSGLRDESQQTELKKRFIELWQVMGKIYEELRAALQAKGVAYEGMLYRDGIEHFDESKLTYDNYVVVGFNVLNRVEQELFDRLKESGKALFYWDYDHYYFDNMQHEAGTFVRENIIRYGNAFADSELYDNLRHLPNIDYISASTDNAQARYLNTWLKEHLTEQEEETAVVLCNEDIAPSVLQSLPYDMVENVNVTMGFKLTQTIPYALLKAYLNLHTKGFDETQRMHMLEEITSLLSHPYILQLYPESEVLIDELLRSKRIYINTAEITYQDARLKALFTFPANNQELLATLSTLISSLGQLFETSTDTDNHMIQLAEESLFQMYRIVENFKSLIEDGTLRITTKTLVRLMQRMMSQVSIPFHGEPAIGLQVMGVLETRNLDFRHLILLSANEGKLPKSSHESSFIPYNLREAFGMNTIQRQNAVYAYYFYRMIQRAEKVTIVYNNGTDGLNKQEPSRYIMQLQVEFPGKLTAWELHSPSQAKGRSEISVAQTDETRRKLQEHFRYDPNKKFSYRLSPSTLNDYLSCRLRFYLKHVERLEPPKEMNTDVDVADLGIIFHKSAELAYDKLTERNNTILKEDIESLLKNEVLMQSFVDEAFRTEFFHSEPNVPLKYNGTQLIVRHVIGSYLHRLLKMDKLRTPFTYIASEKGVYQTYTIESHGTTLEVMLGGTVDRIDSKINEQGEEVVRIIDYKTGGSLKKTKSIEDVFKYGSDQRDKYAFQAFYYAYLLRGQYACITPCLLFMSKTSDETFEPNILIDNHPVLDFSIYHDKFEQLLHATIEEIFNSDVPYTPAPLTEKGETPQSCKYCKFTSLCGREIKPDFWE